LEEFLGKIYFHGNNKSLEELQFALKTGCKIIVDNWLELEHLVICGRALGLRSVPILLRLTPGIECHTHEYIRTGHLDSKFGFDPHQLEAVFRYVREHTILNCIGLHAHIGSQIFERQPHQDLGGVMVEWLGVVAKSPRLRVKNRRIKHRWRFRNLLYRSR
ncbi:MAG: hypothetical protein RLZZ148_2485, partial [Cyanobacteriota bacterium]